MRKPSPAMIVALLSLFVALGGAGMAATGGNLILGQSNSASTPTSLNAPVAGGRTLTLTNLNTAVGSSALKLNVASNHAPFQVSSATKVPSLNSDLLDAHDSTYFLPASGTAANSSALGGEPPSHYLPVSGSVRSWTWAINTLTLAAPSDGDKTAQCPAGDTVLGGGWSVATGDDPDFEIKQSAPTGPPLDGWNIIARNAGTDHTITAYVWAICANVS
jgi:hypothetical protein